MSCEFREIMTSKSRIGKSKQTINKPKRTKKKLGIAKVQLNLSVAQDSRVINRSKIRLEQTPVPLSGRTGFLVLIKQGKNVGLEPPVRHQRRSFSGLHMSHQLPIIGLSICHTTSFPSVTIRRPAGLPDGDIDIGKTDGLHGGVDSVKQSIKLVGVCELCVPVEQTAVRSEKSKVCIFRVVPEIWIWIHHEWSFGFPQIFQHWP